MRRDKPVEDERVKIPSSSFGICSIRDYLCLSTRSLEKANYDNDKYSFLPTNGEFKGVRTFAQMLKHVAANNYVDGAALLTERAPIDVGERDNGPDSVRSKAEIIRFVRGSFEYMQKAIRTVNQGNLMERVEFPGAQGGISRLMIINGAPLGPLWPDDRIPSHEWHRPTGKALNGTIELSGVDVEKTLFSSSPTPKNVSRKLSILR